MTSTDRSVWRASYNSNDMSVYEELLVPRLFTPWAELLVQKLGRSIAPGSRVMDVATGTGAVARVAARVVTATAAGRITAIDLNKAMLEIARSKPPVSNGAPIDYVEADATAISSLDGAVVRKEKDTSVGTYDVVTCQQGLQFFPERAAAVREMFRVLAPGGRVGIAVWRSIEHIHPFLALRDAIRDVLGVEKAEFFASGPWGFDDPKGLRSLLEDAGFVDIELSIEKLPFVFEGGPQQLLATLRQAPPTVGFAELTEAEHEKMIEIVEARLASEIDKADDGGGAAGAIRSYAESNIAIARKP